MSEAIEYVLGIPEANREEAVMLYDEAFGQKFSLAIRSANKRIELLSRSFCLDCAIAAISKGTLLGLAGFSTGESSLTGGITYKRLLDTLGFFKGNWATFVFSLYERKPVPKELLMDGIAVRSDARGKGIGGRLLNELKAYAASQAFDSIRLDVIDTNPGARKLYERNGFIATKSESYESLRWLLGFGGSTTLIHTISK
ncbi:GNAT family N-acetyltransferase [Rubellicoccus peritrichatus]|uniref:GNAT family N-acetyltransferase n=1 Tax=Rubellicoccus peritrichatus TaxID=3080537 RepID=A0AAQ3LCZ7_9BACT|nr:GNAT family N-acetyltransferase [Puniceicoccus sp. CR14]WOO41635.1 GNAT family N-acetyltransferase [Puniceicoccus sp. CR14]